MITKRTVCDIGGINMSVTAPEPRGFDPECVEACRGLMNANDKEDPEDFIETRIFVQLACSSLSSARSRSLK